MADYLKGKHIVVDGAVAEKPIAIDVAGRPDRLTRWQHEVDVTLVSQFVSAT